MYVCVIIKQFVYGFCLGHGVKNKAYYNNLKTLH